MMPGQPWVPNPPPIPQDCSLDHLERCWLTVHNEAAALETQCRLLEQVFRVVQADWRVAQERLAQSEALRDALGAQCMQLLEAGTENLHAVPRPQAHGAVA